MSRKEWIFLRWIAVLLATATMLAAQTSTWVSVGSDGRLHYRTDSNGNRIMDFSFAGYKGGGVALPSVSVARTVNPVSGDNTSNIQAAINAVAALTPDANGFRGAVLLGPGTYNLNGTLNLNASGVVLRGSGSGSGGTTLNLTSAPAHLALSVSGSGSWTTVGTSVSMTDSYVPSGAMSFHVSDASGFSVGDTVLISRPVTAAWVHFMGMDTLVSSTGVPETWLAVGSVIQTDRVITAISGNQITLDVPLADSFDSAFLNPPGGSVTKYTFAGRISQVGIEHLKVIGAPVNVIITSPQYLGVSMSAVIDSWLEDVAFQDTQNTVTVNNTAKRITLDNVHVTHTVTHTGDRMADFGLSGTEILVNKSSSNGTGEWPLLTQGRVTGPIVALNFNSTQQAGIGPHQRWAVGLLTDNASLPNAPDNPDGGATGISYSDRGNHGSGQGWAMGWGVAWNVTTPFLVVQEPPGAHNWCIGCIGTEITATEAGSGKVVPNGIYESLGTKVTPNSLYLAQLCDRLGPAALTNIGYSSSGCTAAVPSFSLSASPGSQSITVGSSTSYTVTVTPANGFSGSVGFSVSGLPTGASASFSPASVTGSGSSTLNVSTSSSTPTGTYTLTVNGTSGSLSATATVTLVVTAVPDFTVSASPASQTVTAGKGTSYTVSVGALNGFNSAVNLSVSGQPAGVAASLNPTSVTGSGNSTLSISTITTAATGSFTLTITGASGSASHSATVNLTVNTPPPPDYSVSASPSSQTVTAGSGTSYTVTVGALNGFSGSVSFAVSGLPAGAAGSFNPASVTSAGTSTLSVSTASSTPTGTSTLTITATSGSLTHTATVSLTVNPAIVCTTATATGTWNNTAFPSHSGTFTAAFDATPSVAKESAAVGLSHGAQTAFTGFANLVVFTTAGTIQARNGGSYTAASTIQFSAGVKYHFRLAINLTAHTYSIFVTPAGGSEITVGSNFAFRTEQNTVTSLDHWGSLVNATPGGTLQVCNFTAQ